MKHFGSVRGPQPGPRRCAGWRPRMAARMRLLGSAALALLCTAVPGAGADVPLNLSRDLVPLGVSATNMLPNQPTLDAGPLLVRGIEYAKSKGMTAVTVDPGAYFFLSLQSTDRHVLVSRANNMTIDFQGADLFLARSQYLGLTFVQCTNTVVQNFTLDYLQLPSTQLRVLAVDSTLRRVQFQPSPGWPDPSLFNTVTTPFNSLEVYLFFFRNGQPAPGLTRFKLQRPVTGDRFGIVNENFPWDTNQVLAGIQPGDTAVVTARGLGPALLIDSSDQFTLRNVKVFSSHSVAVSLRDSTRSLLERVAVMPRPGTDRLISANADGITLDRGNNNTVRLCRSIRTLDDGFSPHALVYGTVQSKTSSRHLKIVRQFADPFPNGTPVVFQSRVDGQILASATVLSQTPPPTQAPVAQGVVDVDFDRDLPDTLTGAVFYSSDPSQRADNTVLERNTVQDLIFARGISLWGLVNASVRGNYLRGTHMASIFATQKLITGDWMSPPLENLSLVNNVIDGAITNAGRGVLEKMAAIELLCQKSDSQPMTVSPHKNITIRNNFVAESARSGIRVENVTGATVSDNLLVNVNTNPSIDGYFQDTFEPYRTEFRAPLVVKTSQGVTTASNVIQSGAPRLSVTDTLLRRLYAYAPGSKVLLNAVSIGSLDGATVMLTDADGSVFVLPVETRTATALTVSLPATAALGGAVITVSSGTTLWRGTLFLDTQDNLPVM